MADGRAPLAYTRWWNTPDGPQCEWVFLKDGELITAPVRADYALSAAMNLLEFVRATRKP